MVRLVNLPNINHHLEEKEEEGTFEAGGPSGPPGPGADQGQGAAVGVVDMAPSSEGSGNANVHNTLGGRAIPVRKVNFSPGVRTPPGRGRRRIGHMLSPGRGARTPQNRGQGLSPNWGNAQEFSTHRVPPPRNSKTFVSPRPVFRPPHRRGEGVRMSKRRGGRGDTASTIRWASKSGKFGPIRTRQTRRNGSHGRVGGRGDGAEDGGRTRRYTRSSSSWSS